MYHKLSFCAYRKSELGAVTRLADQAAHCTIAGNAQEKIVLWVRTLQKQFSGFSPCLQVTPGFKKGEKVLNRLLII